MSAEAPGSSYAQISELVRRKLAMIDEDLVNGIARQAAYDYTSALTGPMRYRVRLIEPGQEDSGLREEIARQLLAREEVVRIIATGTPDFAGAGYHEVDNLRHLPSRYSSDPFQVPYIIFSETGSCFINSPVGVFYERPPEGLPESKSTQNPISLFIKGRLPRLPNVQHSVTLPPASFNLYQESRGPHIQHLYIREEPFPDSGSSFSWALTGKIREAFRQIAQTRWPT